MLQETIDIQQLKPAETYYALNRPGHLFYHPEWLALLMQHYGYRFYMTSGPGQEYMIFAEADGLLGPKLISLPFSDYTIPHVPPHRLPLHLAALQQAFPKAPILLKFADLYADPQDLAFMGKPAGKMFLHRIMLNNLNGVGMSAAFIRGVRKAQKNGLVALASRSQESLEQFYELYYRLRTEKLGLIPQPLSFFELVYEHFIRKGDGFFYEVKQDNELLASAIILKEGNNLYYKWGCSAQERLYMRPNNLLFSELIKLARDTNCQYLDLGLSDLDETRGLIRFKENMGGTPSYIYSYALCPADYPLELEEKLKGIVSQVAGIVVSAKLLPAQTQGFSQALYPLFV